MNWIYKQICILPWLHIQYRINSLSKFLLINDIVISSPKTDKNMMTEPDFSNSIQRITIGIQQLNQNGN